MLKIKDDVDLKELKKFGFKLNKDKTEYEQYGNELFWNVRTVNVKDRCLGHYIEELNYWNSGKDNELIELVFDDLIKADLVEGVPIPLSNNEKLELLNTINSQSKEIERLNNIINELGKYLKENYVIDNPIKFKNDLLDKLKELKEGEE